MTVQDLINHLKFYDLNEPVAYVLWVSEDVETIAKEEEVKLTKIEVASILSDIHKNEDSYHGITWDTLQSHIRDIVDNRKTNQ